MSIENEYIFFPLTKTGYWHNGIHRYKRDNDEAVFSSFFGEILVKNQMLDSNIVYSDKIPCIINKRELAITNSTFLEKYESLSAIDTSKLSQDEKKNILEAIGLSSNPTYILQKHLIKLHDKDFIYYTFIRHLERLNNFHKIKNDEFIFPHEKIGDYGKSEGETNMIHQEYFISSSPSDVFNIPNPEIFDCCNEITETFDLYKKEEQQFEKLYFSAKTNFSVLNKEDDYKKYPHSLHLEIKKYPVKINKFFIDEGNLKIVTNNNAIEAYDKENNKIKQIEIKILNPNTGKNEIMTVDSSLLETENNDWNNHLFYKNKTCFKLSDFWTETDSNILQHWDMHIFVKTDCVLKKYTMPPDMKIFTKLESKQTCYQFSFFKAQENGLTVIDSTDGKKFILINENGNTFCFSKNDIIYNINYWKIFSNSTTFFLKDDLTSYNPNDDDYKNCIDLQKIMKKKNIIKSVDLGINIEKFLTTNKDIIKGCAFQHISEWSQVKINPFKIDHPEETSDLWGKLYIWKKNGKSLSLPREISDSNKFIYFHPDYFENWLFSLHKCFSKKLKAAQDIVIEDWRLKQGNCGIYYNSHDNDQTFCNHAVFETIKLVDKNYLSFLLNKNEPAWDLNKYPSITSFLKKNQSLLLNGKYKYKSSNLWCDVLDYQSQKTKDTGICQISAKQAFYMAQLGYVVIAAWKNLTPMGNDPNTNYSPHFVTVRPCEGEYLGLQLLNVAHVGGDGNGVKNILAAFGRGNSNQICFYCNIKQCFI